ncbi:MAG: hypothetical protein R6X31_15615 [Anaerolineae bacterium]
MKRTALLLALAVLLLVTARVLAMSSPSYRLDWYVPLTGGAGGAASSAHYAVNFTVGQSAMGTSVSTKYGGCLGYWCGAEVEYRVYLPLVLRNS